MPPEEPSRRAAAAATSVPSIVKELVDQFDRPLDFFRELIQNSIDAGSNRVDITLDHDGERAVVRVIDDGEGMDENVIDNYLLVLFRSTKEEDFTKIGKFGIGFVSVFSLRPEMVRVLTGKGGQSWRLDFPSYKRYEKYRLSETREGTAIEVYKQMTKEDFDRLVAESRQAIRYWCKHADARLFFIAQGGTPEQLSEPFGLEGASLNYAEEGTEIQLGFCDDEKPFYGFYNRGLTLKEGAEAYFPGVCFKAKSRYLEHTLTRDNVMMDDNYRKLMEIVHRLAEKSLPERAGVELRDIATRISKLCSDPRAAGEALRAELPGLTGAWGERLPYLRWLTSGFLSRWQRSDWSIFPSLCGSAVPLSKMQESAEEAGGKIFHDEAPNRVTQALAGKGIIVLPSGLVEGGKASAPWLECLAGWLRAGVVRANDEYILPDVLDDERLPALLRSFVSTLRSLDAHSGSKYRGIAAVDLSYPGCPVKDQLFITQKQPGTLSPAKEKPLSSLLWFNKPRRWALINARHPSTEKLARLHAARPGLAAYLCLKMMHLHDGEVPPDRQSEHSNLAEKVEARLLAGALRLDGAPAR